MAAIHEYNKVFGDTPAKPMKEYELHIETEGCIVNIRVGLHNSEGQEVTSIEILPDDHSGEKWLLDGNINNRVIRATA